MNNNANNLQLTLTLDEKYVNPVNIREQIGMWTNPVVISENHFLYKSLSNWSLNPAVGCDHGCTPCFVPNTSTIKQGPALQAFGIKDPDVEWGAYVLLRPWDEKAFLASLRKAENTPDGQWKKDGNRAVMLSSTTDPYQVIKHNDPKRAQELRDHAEFVVRRALELIHERSTLKVRILTRSPLARRDFDLFKKLGNRVLFGMSLPTLRNDLSTIYEPKAPAPTQRLATLQAAAAAGIPVFVAMAPTFPEVDEDDLRATMIAIKKLNPWTVFHEPVNIRAENVKRIEAHAKTLGVTLNTGVFASAEAWQDYALAQLRQAEKVAAEVGLTPRLHLWPDKSLGSKKCCDRQPDPTAHREWLNQYWTRVSEWPKSATQQS